jgi:hypothetical protein
MICLTINNNNNNSVNMWDRSSSFNSDIMKEGSVIEQLDMCDSEFV